jgi:hypothetical protein
LGGSPCVGFISAGITGQTGIAPRFSLDVFVAEQIAYQLGAVAFFCFSGFEYDVVNPPPVMRSFFYQSFSLILAMPTIGKEAVLGRDASVLSGIECPFYDLVAFHGAFSLSAVLPEDRRLVAADHPETTGRAGRPVIPYFHDVKQPVCV